MGATLAGLIGAFPWIGQISVYKIEIFTLAGLLLASSCYMQYRNRNAPCPIDTKQAKGCMILRKISWIILIASVIIYVIGFFFAFLAADIFYG